MRPVAALLLCGALTSCGSPSVRVAAPLPTSVPTRPAASPPSTPSAPAASRAARRPLTGRTVVLDPGHNALNGRQPARAAHLVPAGGFRKACNTSGTATDAGYPEHAFTWDVAQRTAALLRAAGARVVLTRPSDAGFGPCVDRRAAIGNAAHADAVVAIHADGGPAGGSGFHVIEPALAPDRGNAQILGPSAVLALDLRSAFRAATGEGYATYTAKQGLARRSDLAGLNLSRVPAVFIECANMRNTGDATRVSSAAFRQRAAVGIESALVAYLGS